MTLFLCRNVPAWSAGSRFALALALVAACSACRSEISVGEQLQRPDADEPAAVSSSPDEAAGHAGAVGASASSDEDAPSASTPRMEAQADPAPSRQRTPEPDISAGRANMCDALLERVRALGGAQSCAVDGDCHLVAPYYIRPVPTDAPTGVFVSNHDLSSAERLLDEARERQCIGHECDLDGDTFRAKCEDGRCVAKRKCCNCPPLSGTLVPAPATDATVTIRTPHDVVGLNAATGEALVPPVRVTSDQQGQFDWLMGLPDGIELALHVEGQGHASASNGTFDTVVFGHGPYNSLVRVWAVGTASLPQQVAGFTARQDRAQLVGHLYATRAGRRVGAVGCAKIFLDGATGVSSDSDQRYVSANGLPTPLAMQAATEATRGGYYFGNIAKGVHTLRVSVDDGKTFIATRKLVVPYTRAEAVSAYKDMIVQFPIEIEGPNPTPANCRP